MRILVLEPKGRIFIDLIQKHVVRLIDLDELNLFILHANLTSSRLVHLHCTVRHDSI